MEEGWIPAARGQAIEALAKGRHAARTPEKAPFVLPQVGPAAMPPVYVAPPASLSNNQTPLSEGTVEKGSSSRKADWGSAVSPPSYVALAADY